VTRPHLTQTVCGDYFFGSVVGAGAGGMAMGRFVSSIRGGIVIVAFVEGTTAGLVVACGGVVEGTNGAGPLCCSFCSNTLVVRV
jgi:hypothetical protein